MVNEQIRASESDDMQNKKLFNNIETGESSPISKLPTQPPGVLSTILPDIQTIRPSLATVPTRQLSLSQNGQSIQFG
jgi:hypothetical protein